MPHPRCYSCWLAVPALQRYRYLSPAGFDRPIEANHRTRIVVVPLRWLDAKRCVTLLLPHAATPQHAAHLPQARGCPLTGCGWRVAEARRPGDKRAPALRFDGARHLPRSLSGLASVRVLAQREKHGAKGLMSPASHLLHCSDCASSFLLYSSSDLSRPVALMKLFSIFR